MTDPKDREDAAERHEEAAAADRRTADAERDSDKAHDRAQDADRRANNEE